MMNNNDIFKKLRVALMLRDDQIVDILQLVDFRMSKGEIGNLFRSADHPNYVECGDQVLRNFLNGLVIYLRGTKDDPKNPNEIIEKNREAAAKAGAKPRDSKEPIRFPKALNTKNHGTGTNTAKKQTAKKPAKPAKPKSPVENVKFKNGKKKP